MKNINPTYGIQIFQVYRLFKLSEIEVTISSPMKLQKICFLQGKGAVNIDGFDLPNFLRAVVGDYGGGLGNGARLLNERALHMK